MALPVRFGLGPAGLLGVRTAGQWRDLARRAEGAGYHALCLGDHLDERAAPGPTAVLLAEATESLRIGVHVYANDFRHPVLLAREINTVAMLTGGRLDAGIGAGWMHADYARAGLTFDRPGLRIARLAEAVEIVRATWTDERVDHQGAHYDVHDLPGVALLGGVPRPRLVMGGGGERMLALAVRHADIVTVNVRLDAGRLGPERGATATADATAAKLAVIRTAAAARTPPPELQAELHYVEVTDDRDAGIARAASELGLAEADAAASPHVLVGSVTTIRETLAERQERYGFGYYCMSAAHLDGFAAVIAAG